MEYVVEFVKPHEDLAKVLNRPGQDLVAVFSGVNGNTGLNGWTVVFRRSKPKKK
jgi:hypothetical protein